LFRAALLQLRTWISCLEDDFQLRHGFTAAFHPSTTRPCGCFSPQFDSNLSISLSDIAHTKTQPPTEYSSTTHHHQVSVTAVSMSDNLCGPSAPTKGLLGHLDRDRTLQQDRVAGSPASAAGVSCTSRPLLWRANLTCIVFPINYPRLIQHSCWGCLFRQIHRCLASAQSSGQCRRSGPCQTVRQPQSQPVSLDAVPASLPWPRRHPLGRQGPNRS
jgi:hypothetical protein